VRKFADLLEKNEDTLADLQTSETGKPITQSLAEIRATRVRTNWFCDNVEEATRDQVVHSVNGKPTEIIKREPLGVLSNISSWNYPWFTGTNVWIPALLTGNAILYKPSEYSVLIGTKAIEMLHQAGVPKTVIVTCPGGPEIGSEMLKLPIQGMFFTGSYNTGVKLAQGFAKTLAPLQLELGGKDAVYVHHDVDIKIAAETIAEGVFYNAGQSCCKVERIYVHKDVYDKFLEAFCEIVKAYKIGDPKDKTTYIGPLTRSQQVNILDAHIKDAVEKGAKTAVGGGRIQREGFYYPPTVLTNVNHTMVIMREESFGPVCGIQQVADHEEGTKLMADCRYGLTAGVFSKDEKLATDILTQLNTGTVYWNCCDKVSVRLPWTGRMDSGTGLTCGHEGIRNFTQPKSWLLHYPK